MSILPRQARDKHRNIGKALKRDAFLQGELYVQALRDLDTLLATDSAFLLGTWLESARKLGGNMTDCDDTVLGDKLSSCDDFMEWNARAQITTWHPTGQKTHDLLRCRFILKMIILPRQARDKHRGNSERDAFSYRFADQPDATD